MTRSAGEDDVCFADLACKDVACVNMMLCHIIGLRRKRQQILVKGDKISKI